MKLRYQYLWLSGALLAMLTGTSYAGQSSDNNLNGGLNVAVDLRHRIVIPQIIYFRIGSSRPGDIDKLRFQVAPGGAAAGNNQAYSGSSTPPVGDSTPIAATGGGALNVFIAANVGTLTLTYDLSNPSGLGDGAGNFIPFDEITVVSADPTGLPTPVLANAGAGGAIGVPIVGNQFGGRVISRRTTWTYSYDNNQVVRAGIYQGRVRYTVSAP